MAQHIDREHARAAIREGNAQAAELRAKKVFDFLGTLDTGDRMKYYAIAYALGKRRLLGDPWTQWFKATSRSEIASMLNEHLHYEQYLIVRDTVLKLPERMNYSTEAEAIHEITKVLMS